MRKITKSKPWGWGIPKGVWAVCWDCGDKAFPRTKRWKEKNMAGITCHMGDCKACGKKNVVLVPNRDYGDEQAGPDWD